MKYILIFLLGLITLQVNAQSSKTIGSSTTAGGDLQGIYPNPQIKQNIINRANLTPGLRDSLTRFRHDTIIKHSVDGNINLGSIVNTLGRYNRVYVLVLGESGFNQGVIMPSGTDTIRNTEFHVTYVAEDTLSSCQIAAFDGFAVFYTPPSIDQSIVVRSLASGSTAMLKPMYVSGAWIWITAVSKNIYGSFFEDATGITALTTDVVASGTGSVAATIQPSAVTTAKIADANVTLAKLATNSVNSSKIVDGSVALADIASNSVDNTKIVDYSITGTDLNYLTLRAGDASNAILRFSNGTDKTTVNGGEWLFDGNRLGFAISSTKKRLPLFNDAAPTGGQLMVGNGTDFTLATLTNGYAQTITNGSGSISITPDTTKVIPYLPSGEIGNGTRDGYYRTQTSFGHQFYNNGFRIQNSSLATTSGSTQLYVSNGTNDVGHLLVVSSAGATSSQTYVNNGANGKSTTLDYKGFNTQVYYSAIDPRSQAVTNYQIDGQYGIVRLTDGTITTITLPEIVGNPTTNQVAVGFTLHLTVNSPTTATITRAGSDTIEVHGAAAAANTVTATTGTIYSKTYVATGSNTWTVY